MKISNKEGKNVAGLDVNANNGSLGINNKDGKPVVGLFASEIGGMLITLDNKGETTSTLP